MTRMLSALTRRPAGLALRGSARDPSRDTSRQTMRAFVRTLARLATPPREPAEEGTR